MIIKSVTDIGLKRQKNEDFIYSSKDPEFPLFILADGMGGHNSGEIASKLSVRTIKKFFLSHREKLNNEDDLIYVIKEGIKKANIEIYNKSFHSPKYKGMGTTLTLAYILNEKIYIGHVGDSRAYFINKDDIKQITEDHSLVNLWVKSGSISNEEAKNHPKRNIIMKALGIYEDVEIDIYTLGYNSEDVLMICSDGLTNMLDDKEIFDIINKEEINTSYETLIKESKNNGGLDNISIIIIKFI